MKSGDNMPSLVTHYIHSKNVLKELKEAPNIDLNTYYTFSQSHDNLFYHPSKKIRKIGKYAHHHQTQKYLINIIKYILDNNLQNNKNIMGYLYGSINHYVLDTTAHPYIFYKGGVYREYDEKSHKYYGKHSEIEKTIDAIYFEKNFNKKYQKAKLNKTFKTTKSLDKNIKECLNYAYYSTYKEKNIYSKYKTSIRCANIIAKLIFNDPYGIKKKIYNMINKISKKKKIQTCYSTYYTKINYEIINNKNKPWNNPCDKNIKYQKSFEDLMNESTKKSISIIKEVNEVLNHKKDIKSLNNIIPDIDYSTGFPIKEDRTLKYFEY